MNLSALFIKRPIATTLIVLGLMVFGVMSYRAAAGQRSADHRLPHDPGAGEPAGRQPRDDGGGGRAAAREAVRDDRRLDSINSNSSLGFTTITLQFNLDRDIDAAAAGRAVDDRADLATAADADAGAALVSEGEPWRRPGDAAGAVFVDAAELAGGRIRGVDDCAAHLDGAGRRAGAGGRRGEIRGTHRSRPAQPRRRTGIGIDEAARRFSVNVNLPTGTIYGADRPTRSWPMGSSSARGYASTIVAYRNGNPVRLERLRTSTTASRTTSRRSGSTASARSPCRCRSSQAPTPSRSSSRQGAAAEVPRAVAAGDHARHPQRPVDRHPRIGPGHQDDAAADDRAGGAGHLPVPAQHLGDGHSQPDAAVSLVATFAVMYQLHYSLDNLSLMALILSVGFIVDNTIVILENIVRHMEMGKSPMRAAMEGSKEIAFTIVSMTLALVAVFIPVLFMGGIVGRLLNEFAVTIAVAILVSGFVSISLTPMLCSRFLTPPERSTTAGSSTRPSGCSTPGGGLRLSRCGRVCASTPSRWRSRLCSSAATGYLFTLIPKGSCRTRTSGAST